MNKPRKISDILPSTCQKLLKSVEICLSSDKNKSAQFFETRCIVYSALMMTVSEIQRQFKHFRLFLFVPLL